MYIYIYVNIWYPPSKVYFFHGQSGYQVCIYIYIIYNLSSAIKLRGCVFFRNAKIMQNQKPNGGPKVTSFKQGPITPFIGVITPATHSKGHLKGPS